MPHKGALSPAPQRCPYNRGSQVFGLERKSYASVRAVDPESNLITVETAGGRTVTYDPARLAGVTVYEQEVRAFALGDRVQFLTPWKEQKIGTRDLGTVKYLDQVGNIRVQLDDSDPMENLNQNKHLDHAYCMTSHAAQGVTVDRVLVHVDTGETRIQALINETLAYVALSRMRHDAQIFTDNQERLAKSLSRQQQNSTALSQEEIERQAVQVIAM